MMHLKNKNGNRFIVSMCCNDVWLQYQGQDIKQSIAVNAKEEAMYAGVNYTIKSGVVRLIGNCLSRKCRIAGEEWSSNFKREVQEIKN